MGDLVNAFAIWQVWRVDESSDSSSALSLSKVQSEGGSVGENVAANWLCWISPHCIWFGMNLVRYQDKRVVHISELLQVLEMAVQFLLPVCKHTTSDEFSTEVACQ